MSLENARFKRLATGRITALMPDATVLPAGPTLLVKEAGRFAYIMPESLNGLDDDQVIALVSGMLKGAGA